MKRRWLVAAALVCLLFGVAPRVLAATEAASEPEQSLPIIFENGIHYIEDPLYPQQRLTLFCMNSKLHWPHHTDDMGQVQVPGYTEGYITEDDFDSPEQFQEFERRLSKILYAGYPYNGERLYSIVENSADYVPTEEQFNEMLMVPAVLQTDFPYLGHHKFTYDDWENNNEQHLEELRQFVEAVIKLNLNPGSTTAHGLTYEDIATMPFYKAAFSIVNCNNDTPLESFKFFFGGSRFVTEEEAYNATQNAVWYLLKEYGIPDNDVTVLPDQLSQALYTYSEHGGLLRAEPSMDDIKVVGDLGFTYNPKDGLWHSGTLHIDEPDEYRGIYELDLPKGMTALCDNLTYVYGDEDYELVSDHEPELGESFGISAHFQWMEAFRQYSPTPDVEVGGKKFQHMIGAVVHPTVLTRRINVASEHVGSIAIEKRVVGEDQCDRAFAFRLTLLEEPDISGLYGDLEFHNGVAEFTLAAGERKVAANLPSGAPYVVEEISEGEEGEYASSLQNGTGEVQIGETVEVLCTNTRLYDVSLGKLVTGEGGEHDREFTFEISLRDAAGKPLNGTFAYDGAVLPDCQEQGIQPPSSGALKFRNGKARIKLSHGQQVLLRGIPFGATFEVVELEADKDGYATTYNGATGSSRVSVQGDASMLVVNEKQPQDPEVPQKPEIPQQPGRPEIPQSPQAPHNTGRPENPGSQGGLPQTGDVSISLAFGALSAGAAALGVGGIRRRRR